MKTLSDMVWIEFRKAIRSRMPLWTLIGSMFMPVGVAILILLAKNPEISHRLGLVGAKANLAAYAAADWSSYLVLFAEVIAGGGFIFFIIIISWVFGREFTDGTVKDILAVPVPRSSILLAKYFVVVVWSVAIAIIMLLFGILMGVLIHLPGGTTGVILSGSMDAAITICLIIAVVLPFSFFASVGRGYLLPIVFAFLCLIMANLMMVLGWAEYFPWSVTMLYAQGESSLPSISFFLVIFTSLVGMTATYLWWMYADQNR
jgi:ABC-2 type transport system permease protein